MTRKIPPLNADEWAPAFPLPDVTVVRGPRGGLYVQWDDQGRRQAMLAGPAKTFARRLLRAAEQAEQLRQGRPGATGRSRT